ncbi:MAG: trigger factor [Gemmatimonadetes bacterium]|nr:trigger factor [Gemmatimonadota bacterium]
MPRGPRPVTFVPAMTEITVTKTAEDAASRAFRVSVPVDRVHAAEKRALAEYTKRARIPGFRPGKAPGEVVRKRFGDAIKQWIVEEVVREGWEKARTDQDLKPVNDPSIRNLKFEDGQPMEFEVVVEVKPEIQLTRLGGFEVERRVPPVTDQQVGEQLDQLRESRAAWLPVEGQPPVEGNMVRVDVAAIEADGVQKPQSYTVVIGQGQTVAALEEQFLKMQPGEVAETEIKFPEDHPDPARRGTSRRVQVTLHEVKRQELPPLDDDFAKSMGDFEDLDALRAVVRSDLARAAEREADAGVREQLLQQVIEANGIAAPPSLVDRALHAYLHAYNIPHERAEAFYGEFRPVAEGQVKRELALGAIAEGQKLFCTEADLDARIAALAAARGTSPNEVYAQLEKAKRLAELERGITEEKVFEFLKSQSTVKEA